MKPSVYIIDYQILSAIGANKGECLENLIDGKYGIKTQENSFSKHQLPFGVLPLSDQTILDKLNEIETDLAINWQIVPRTAKINILLSILLKQWFDFPISSDRKAYISANTVGGIDRTELFLSQKGNSTNLKYHEAGSSTKLFLDLIGNSMYHTTISTACSSSANSIMLAGKMIENQEKDLVIAGGVDALSKYTINGFNSLKILDSGHCKPFDKNRKGLNLGEGGAYIVLASERFIKTHAIQPIAILSGYANANDAFHQTASSPEGIGNYIAMKEALNKANLKADAINYINAHGTGTENNDFSENHAIARIFNNKKTYMSSTKTYTGHTLGAAGAIEAVFSIMAIENQIAWGQGKAIDLLENIHLPLLTKHKKLKINHVLSNSFGFGGNCSSLIISKITN